MSLARVAYTVLLSAVLLASCSRIDYEEERFRSARRARSVLKLVEFRKELHDVPQAAAALRLIDKHYEHALAKAVPSTHAVFDKALLEHLRSVADPRIAVRVQPPSIRGDRAELAYFAAARSFDSSFASAANEAAARAFPYELVSFASDTTYGFDPAEGAVEVELIWSVRTSGDFFELPSTYLLDASGAQRVPGIAIDASLRFRIPGHSEPFEFSFTASPSSIRYTAFLGMPTREDIFSGMAKSALAEVVGQLWPTMEQVP